MLFGRCVSLGASRRLNSPQWSSQSLPKVPSSGRRKAHPNAVCNGDLRRLRDMAGELPASATATLNVCNAVRVLSSAPRSSISGSDKSNSTHNISKPSTAVSSSIVHSCTSSASTSSCLSHSHHHSSTSHGCKSSACNNGSSSSSNDKSGSSSSSSSGRRHSNSNTAATLALPSLPQQPRQSQNSYASSSQTADHHLVVEDMTPDNWRTPLRRPGSVVALGKFDALHRGHRALAQAAEGLARDIAATAVHPPAASSASAGAAVTARPLSVESSTYSTSNDGRSCNCSCSSSSSGSYGSVAAASDEVHGKVSGADGGYGSNGGSSTVGDVVLLSFSGMAEVLGWPRRLPLTAPQDRARVLTSWGKKSCGAGLSSSEACCTSTTSTAAAAAGEHEQQQACRTRSNSGANSSSRIGVDGEKCGGSISGSNSNIGSTFSSSHCLSTNTPPVAKATSVASPASARCTSSPQSAQHDTALPPRLPRLRTLPFSQIRSMSPEQFVGLLARELGAAGVVAGRNYRFGYKAAGDAEALVRLGQLYGMRVQIVDLVALPDNREEEGAANCLANGSSVAGGSSSGSSAGSSIAGQEEGRQEEQQQQEEEQGGGSCVSSSRIRELLAAGRVGSVERLLGRKYRLVCELGAAAAGSGGGGGGVETAVQAAGAQVVSGASAGEEVASTSAAATARGKGEPAEVGSGASGRRSSTTARMLFVPYSCYLNQPPANGKYRVSVRVVAAGVVGAEVPLEDAYVCAANRHGSTASACASVTLSDTGLFLDMESEWSNTVVGSDGNGSVSLLVDFDACS